ncbi:hypothetical protein GE115_17415 [Agromyces sp. CFH 90414]|uniref:Uncharacterized protein n=1 Tax=Agromyces agglutinans TaxID=2662258 RepID=A0A6I2FG42_9MICO|nr:hypothetical protein [Agromyces agglutinans]MRG61640.1 hypothetical protein [Agromyces agglutinans]
MKEFGLDTPGRPGAPRENSFDLRIRGEWLVDDATLPTDRRAAGTNRRAAAAARTDSL